MDSTALDAHKNIQRVLWLDASEVFLSDLPTLLKNSGFDLTCHQSKQEALDEIKIKIPDLIVCDLSNPKNHGFDFIVQVRKNHSLSSIPILALTQKTDTDSMSRSISVGANAFCSKDNLHYTIKPQLTALLRLKAFSMDEHIIKQTEHDLVYQALLNSINEGLIIYNPEGTIIKYNTCAFKILELSEAQLLEQNKTNPSLKAIHKDGSDFNVEDYPFRQAQKTGKIISNVTMGLQLPDNQVKWIRINAVPVMISDGQHVIVTFSDVTERSKAFHKAKLASLGEMSAGIAHEINNPLAIIEGSLRLLLRFPGYPKEFKIQIDTIEKSTQRISRIITGLRKFSRTSDKQKFMPHQLKIILNEVLTLIDLNLKRNFVHIQIFCNTDCRILCNEIEIEQVVMNLINNSIDAIKNSNERWIKIVVVELEFEVLLQIQDSGHGLTEEVADKLFQPFFTTKIVGEGTGLGLSIVKGILDDHNAQIQLNRNFANTCFEIKFEKYKEVQNVD